MKSQTTIHTKQNPLRNYAISSVGISLAENHNYEPTWWYNISLKLPKLDPRA